METMKRIEWTQSGHAISVEVTAEGFTATIDGKKQDGSQIALPAPRDKSAFDARDAAGTIGNLIIYTPRAKELLAIRAELKAQKPVDPLEVLKSLESDVRDAEYAVQEHQGNPTYTYHKLHEAQAALSTWIAANKDVYDTEIARRQQVIEANRTPIGDIFNY